jgi:hypothetical protein
MGWVDDAESHCSRGGVHHYERSRPSRKAAGAINPDGAKTLNEYKAFDIRFNKRDRTHSELLARAREAR